MLQAKLNGALTEHAAAGSTHETQVSGGHSSQHQAREGQEKQMQSQQRKQQQMHHEGKHYEFELSKWWQLHAAKEAALNPKVRSAYVTDEAGATKIIAKSGREIRKEELRVGWAKETAEFNDVNRDVTASAPNTSFGFKLAQAQAVEQTLAAMDKESTDKATEFKPTSDPVREEMMELGARTPENPYTKLTHDDMATAQDARADAIRARKARFDVKLEEQRKDNKASVTECKEELEGQLIAIVKVTGDPTVEALMTIKEDTSADLDSVATQPQTDNLDNDQQASSTDQVSAHPPEPKFAKKGSRLTVVSPQEQMALNEREQSSGQHELEAACFNGLTEAQEEGEPAAQAFNVQGLQGLGQHEQDIAGAEPEVT
ncbi:MAG TPA: hypothetical protein VLA31_01120, partial [Burkholderiaceae bacterium]|nr:hypothetical protein [Burkholderiaceae bacterium]